MRLPAALVSELRASARRGEPLLAAFDFDGVLARLRRVPSASRMSRATRDAVALVADAPGTAFLVVSGRARPFLRAALAGTGAALAGDHGMELTGIGRDWRHPSFASHARTAKALAARVARATRGLRGVRVELKTTAVAVHWRRAPAVRRDPARLRAALSALLPRGWRVAPGLMVWELRPALAWGKGDAVARAARLLGARALFAGDDETDEEGFRRLGASAWTVRVGPGRTAARFRLRGIAGVNALLREISRIRRQAEAPSRRTRAKSSTRRAPQR